MHKLLDYSDVVGKPRTCVFLIGYAISNSGILKIDSVSLLGQFR